MSPLVSSLPPQTFDPAQARRQLRAVGRAHAGRRLVAGLLPVAAGALLLALLGRHWGSNPAGLGVLAALATLGALAAGWWLGPLWQLRPATVAPRLDRQFPALEDSAALLLREPEDLNLLEQLQQQRVARRLRELHAARQLALPLAYARPALLAGALLVISALVALLLSPAAPVPALEDSAALLLREPEDLNLLEQLQQQRVARRLRELHAARQLALPVAYARPALLAGALLVISASVVLLPSPAAPGPARPAAVAVRFGPPAPPAAGRVTARITETRLLVTPPAYTRQPAFAPAQASFACPAGARVRWQVRVRPDRSPGGRPGGPRPNPSDLVPELEISGRRRRLQPVAGQPNLFFLEQTLTAPALYRLRYAGTVSDDYAIDVQPDQAPVLRIQTPKPYTLVEFGQRSTLPVQATVRDDYGLSRAELVITVAQGQGEGVKFREVRRDLGAGRLGAQPTQLRLSSRLNLPELGLTYGDELYFYLSARDNAGHATRTDAYLVQWQDTAVADGALDAGLGVKVAPAYFRSQRQLIIDTEKLLAEKARLDAPTLARRANDLGADQQTLRLRYGKFMGEESEGSIGAAAPVAEAAEGPDHEDHENHENHADSDHAAPAAGAEADHAHEHAEPAAGGLLSPTAATDALLAPYQHLHDDAETADFLEPAVKAKLRAVLDQMWAAELRLRTAQLAAALPYEYRALRLLKQVQQQTRAYVKKAGFVTPPLPEPTLRLTGELAGAAAPRRQQTRPAAPQQPVVRAALRWLSAAAGPAPPADLRPLEAAAPVLAGAALREPGRYLPALRALRQLGAEARAGRPPCASCRPPLERALTDLLPAPTPAPAAAPAPDRLARRYFQALGN